jgi:hypothetical protein
MATSEKPEKTEAGTLSASSAPRPARLWIFYVAMAAAYLAAAAPLAYYSRDAINPDGIAYVQAARHYAAGQGGLAVNGWFSPLLSWLLVPSVWMGVEPFLAERALGVLYGLLFAAGAVRLTKTMGGERYAGWAFGAALLLAGRTVFVEVTPDFLLAAGLTWYFALSAEMVLGSPTVRKAVLVGLVGGACYYAKAYALPVVLAHLAITLVVRWWAGRKQRGLARAAVPPAIAMGVAILICAPWIVAISAQFGRFTTNTSASLSARSWLSAKSGVPRASRTGYPHIQLQQPRAGRITVWENPAEAQGEWPAWPQEGGDNWWKYEWQTIRYNAGEMVSALGKADRIQLLAIGAVVALLLALLARGAGERRV